MGRMAPWDSDLGLGVIEGAMSMSRLLRSLLRSLSLSQEGVVDRIVEGAVELLMVEGRYSGNLR